MIQSRAMDNLLRLFFESEEVRRLLRQRFEAGPPTPVNRIKQRYATPEARGAAAAKQFDPFSRN